MARKDNSPSISFFSFQDIITSITGIMFLVVMILVLLIVTRQKRSSQNNPMDSQMQELKKQIVELQTQIEKQAKLQETIRNRLEELKQLDVTTLPQRKEELILQLQEITKSMEEEKQEQEALQKQIESYKTEIEKYRKSIEFEEEIKAKNDDLIATMKNTKENAEKLLAKNSKMVRFVWKSSITQKPLLVLCAEGKIEVSELNATAPLAEFKNTSQAKLCADFLKWTSSLSPKDTYIVLLAKPSSFEYVEYIAAKLGDNGFKRGREIFPEDMDGIIGGQN